MRVLIAAHGFPPTRSAGAERRAERMANWLAGHGHVVEVFAVERVDAAEFHVETSSPAPFTLFRLHRASCAMAAGEGGLRDSYDYAPLGAALRKVVEDTTFDVVHLISGHLLACQTIAVAREHGLPVAVTLTEFWFMCARLNLSQPGGILCAGPETTEKCVHCLARDKRRYRYLEALMPSGVEVYWRAARRLPVSRERREEMQRRQTFLRAALDAADLVISPSRFLTEKFAGFGFDTARHRFIRQGLTHTSTAPPARASRPASPLRFGYVGQIQQHKGVDLLVDAVLAVREAGRDVTLDIWGPGTGAPDYVRRLTARSSGTPAIRWRGTYSGDEVWQVLRELDALVVPSRWYENSPNVILEAFAMDVPVVATDLGGMSELVQHERNGLLFTLNDAASLARQLTRLADDPGLLERLRTGIPEVKSLDEEMSQTVTEYGRLLRGSAEPETRQGNA